MVYTVFRELRLYSVLKGRGQGAREIGAGQHLRANPSSAIPDCNLGQHPAIRYKRSQSEDAYTGTKVFKLRHLSGSQIPADTDNLFLLQ